MAEFYWDFRHYELSEASEGSVRCIAGSPTRCKKMGGKECSTNRTCTATNRDSATNTARAQRVGNRHLQHEVLVSDRWRRSRGARSAPRRSRIVWDSIKNFGLVKTPALDGAIPRLVEPRCSHHKRADPPAGRLEQVTVGRRPRLDGFDLHLGSTHPLQQPVEVRGRAQLDTHQRLAGLTVIALDVLE